MALSEFQVARALRMSLYDGALATVMGSWAGGIFLVGYALHVLGATNVQTGVLAALPVAANVAQILGAMWIEAFNHRRPFSIATVTVGRLCWIPILLLPLPLFSGWADQRVWLLMLLYGASCFCGSLSGVAWLEWMSDLIPEKIRGSYLAKRNVVCAAAGMVAVLAGGAFMDAWAGRHGDAISLGYVWLFGVSIVFGMVSSWFLARVPDPKINLARGGRRFDVAALVRPLQDANFRRIVVYAGAFTFATQLAGPFYNVYMIENLGVPLGRITWFLTAATLASLFMWRIWGPISDTMGNKPVLTVAGLAYAGVPFVWMSATAAAPETPLLLAQLLTGGLTAATALAQVNILVKLAPPTGRAVYIAVFNAMMGLAAGLAPIVGGWLVDALADVHVAVGGWVLSGLPLLFLISAALQVLTLLPLLGVKEVGAASPYAVLMQLRNDLDPRTGIASASDFVLLHKSRAEDVLSRLDRATDIWAERSEFRIGQGFDAVQRRLKRPLAAMWRFLNED